MTSTKSFPWLSLAVLCLLAFSLVLPAHAAPGSRVVISQVSGGGGNTNAQYKNDFIELFNAGTDAQDLAGWSVQYTSVTGSTWQVTTLSGTIQPGHYYLVQEAAGAGAQPLLPTPDAAGSIAMSATNGKVALVSSATALSGVCPAGFVVDILGFGPTANCFEGAPTALLSNTTAAIRTNVCVDVGNNATEFAILAPTPRNSASPTTACSGPTDPSGIGLATPASADLGTTTLLTVAVTPGSAPSSGLAVKTNLSAIGGSAAQDFFDDGSNGDASAGDNIFSYTATVANNTTLGDKSLTATITDAQARHATATIALKVTTPSAFYPIHQIRSTSANIMGYPVETSGVITGRRSNGFYLQEKNGTFDGANSLAIYVYTGSVPPIAAAVGQEVYVTGTLAQYPVGITPTELEITGVTIKTYVGTAPLPDPVEIVPDSTLTQAAQFEKYAGMLARIANTKVTGPTNSGAFYVTTATTPRPFREPGVEVGLQLPTGAGQNVPRYDGNPEVLRVDMSGCLLPANLATGDTTGDLLGNLGYYYSSTYGGAYSLFTCVTGTTSQHAAALPTPGENEFSVVSFNMWNFTATDTQLSKASLEIRDILKMPDIIGVEEMADLASLQAVADRVNTDAQASGFSPNYQAHLGQLSGTQNIGFLYRADHVTNPTFTVLANASYMTGTCNSYKLWDRQPLQMDATVTLPGRVPTPITVIVNHLRSLIDIELNDTAGYCTRLKRSLGAEALAQILANMQDEGRNLITLGDMNAFDFNDGYVDVMGALTGNPAPESEVTLLSRDWIDPNLTDLIKSWPDKTIYTYVENGSAQSLDHIVVNNALLALPHRVEVAHVNADFPLAFSADATRPERISDHDQPVAYFTLPKANSVPVAQSQAAETPEGSPVAITLAATDNDGDILTYTVGTASHGLVSGTAPNLTYTPDAGYAGPDSFTFTANDGHADSNAAVVTLNILQVAPSVAPATLTFADQAVNSTSSSLFTTLTNNSSAPLVIDSLTASGDFSVSLNGCPASVAAHATCRVFVNFKPTASSLRSGVLTINSSAVTKTVALSGNGLGSISISPAALTFADQAVNSYSSSQRVTVMNNTGADAAIVPVASANFAVSLNGCPATLPNASSCYVYVQFRPKASGPLTGTLSLGTASISLAGNAYGSLGVSVASLAFADQAVNTYSSSQLVTVTNNTGSALSLTPTASANFGVSLNGCPASLANGSSCSVYVQFRPKAAGPLTGTLTVGTATVSLTGKGIGTLAVSASSLTFGSLAVNNYSSSQTVTVTNNTGAAVSFTPTATANFRVSLNGCPASLANGTSCNVFAQFHPTTTGDLTGTLSIGTASVSLSGTGQ